MIFRFHKIGFRKPYISPMVPSKHKFPFPKCGQIMLGYVGPTYESFIQTTLKGAFGDSKILLLAFISFPKHGFAYSFHLFQLKLVTSLPRVQNLGWDWCDSAMLSIRLITKSKLVEKIKNHKMKKFGRTIQSLCLDLHLHPSNLNFCISYGWFIFDLMPSNLRH